MMQRPPYVSVIDPVGPAFERVKTVLFRPFDLGRWFVIGFGAWLARLGTAGSGGGGGAGGGAGVPGPPGGISWEASDIPDQVRHGLGQAWEFILHNLDWLIPVIVVGLGIIIGLWLLVIWLSSRGRFMFLYCVAQNRAEVVHPWHYFRRHGNSLFGFRLAVGLITFATALVFLALIGFLVFLATTRVGFNYFTIAGIACCSLLFLATTIVSGVVMKFTHDFALPIMYLHTPSSLAAWHVLLDILAFNKARFFLYLLFQIVIYLVKGMILVAAACLTCGCGCCLMLIPYIGTVALLPIFVFQRAYSLYYLAQYGPQFNAFPAPPAGTAPPPVPGA
jgi:hypothetical protein